MSGLRPESHVAQQIRRDKLRIQNVQEDFPTTTNIEQLSLQQQQQHSGLSSSDLVHVRNVRNAANMLYEPPPPSYNTFPSTTEILNFSSSSSSPSSSSSMMPPPPHHHHHSPYVSFPHSSSEPPLGYDWMLNYGTTPVVPETNNVNVSVYHHPTATSTTSTTMAKPSSSYNELIQGQFGEIHAPPSQNTLQDIVKSASISAQGSDMHGVWMGNQFGNANLSDSVNNPQGLSLSLSSNPQSKILGFPFGDEPCGSDDPPSNSHNQYSKSAKSVMRDCGKSLHELVVGMTGGSNGGGDGGGGCYRSVGPLGPFTGYATILKSSRFLKPAQELLDEFCGLCGPNVMMMMMMSDVSTKDSGNNAGGGGVSSSSGAGGGDGGGGSSSNSFGYYSRPEYQQKKAKLLYMQEEVTRKYKQYHQQMQMVVSSFESVAGLSSATPYISIALKSVTRNFRCLKNAILDQIKHTREVLGEDFSGSTSGTSKLDSTDMARLRYMDQSFRKNRTGFLEPQQVWRPQRGLPERAVAILKAWLFEHFLHPYPTDTDKHMLATQTGLSRNQVSNWFINARVRVWKPMVEEIHNLETKGGGSNMMEGTSATEGTSSRQQVVGIVDHEAMNKFGKHNNGGGDHHAIIIPEKQLQLHCLEMSSLGGGVNAAAAAVEGGEVFMSAEQWNQEKRSKMECHQVAPASMDGTLMGFVPYRRGGGGGGGGLDVGGLGSVSLTLGLRHGVEGVQQQQHLQQQQEDQLRRHFGEHMIHDFVG